MSKLGDIARDIGSLFDAGYGGKDIGKGNSSFSATDVGSLTGCSSSEAARAGHDARSDMAKDTSYGGWGISADRAKK